MKLKKLEKTWRNLKKLGGKFKENWKPLINLIKLNKIKEKKNSLIILKFLENLAILGKSCNSWDFLWASKYAIDSWWNWILLNKICFKQDTQSRFKKNVQRKNRTRRALSRSPLPFLNSTYRLGGDNFLVNSLIIFHRHCLKEVILIYAQKN